MKTGLTMLGTGGLLAVFLGAAIVPAGAEAQPRSAGPGELGICELLDRVVALPCEGEGQAAPAPGHERGAASVDESSQVRRVGTTVRYDPKRLAVTFRRGTSRRVVEATFARAGVVLEQAVPAIAAYMAGVDPARSDSALATLRDSPAVATAGREILVGALDTGPNDADWPQQWGLRLTGIPQAWSRTLGATRVVVAVLDTGVDPAQADLQGALVPGYDFVGNTATPADDEGHGTAVAGIIAARTNNRVGIAGVCDACLVMPVKVLDQNGVGDDSVIAAGIVWAADHGAKVINLSLGGPGATPDLSDAIAYAVGKGAVIVAAAGNEATTVPFYPAADPRAVSVAGTTPVDHPYPWSDFGGWVKLAAPGCNLAPILRGGYGTFCGTSAAAPIVAGLAGLAFAANPSATPDQIEQALEHPAVPLAGLVQYGRVNAPGTLALVAPDRPATAAPAAQHRHRPRRHARTDHQRARGGQ